MFPFPSSTITEAMDNKQENHGQIHVNFLVFIPTT